MVLIGRVRSLRCRQSQYWKLLNNLYKALNGKNNVWDAINAFGAPAAKAEYAVAA